MSIAIVMIVVGLGLIAAAFLLSSIDGLVFTYFAGWLMLLFGIMFAFAGVPW